MSNRLEKQPFDDRLKALERIERRRLLLRLLAASPRAGSCVDFDELDPNVGGLDRSADGPNRSADGLDPFVAYRRLHLPVLEDGEFVRWDRENRRVTKGPRFDELEPFLELLQDLRDDLPGRWV